MHALIHWTRKYFMLISVHFLFQLLVVALSVWAFADFVSIVEFQNFTRTKFFKAFFILTINHYYKPNRTCGNLKCHTQTLVPISSTVKTWLAKYIYLTNINCPVYSKNKRYVYYEVYSVTGENKNKLYPTYCITLFCKQQLSGFLFYLWSWSRYKVS